MTMFLRRNRGYVAGLIGLSVLLSGTACERKPEPPPGPNVLLITLDTTRADRLGCYGHAGGTSRNLDALAAEGTLFTNAMTAAAVTPVSHASIMTGEYPYTHGLRVMHGLYENRLSESRVTLAEVLRDAGYQTGAFVSAFPVTEYFGLNQGFETFDDDFIIDGESAIVSKRGIVNTNKNQRRADATTDRALAWLKKARAPFFLWLHYFDPHDTKLLPPTEFMKQFGAKTPLSREDELRAIYDVEVRYMDQQIGRVLDYLRDSHRLDTTIVVVTSDHGEGLGDHNWWTHGILYQEQIHAPLIFRGPSIPAGRKVDYLVRSIDIMPTVLELAGVKPAPAPDMDGANLTPLFADNAADPQRTAYADSINMLTYGSPEGTDEKNDVLFAVRDGRWKYIHHALRPLESELYDLASDPGEQKNLYRSNPMQAIRLLENLDARHCYPKKRGKKQPMNATNRKRLEQLGYIQSRPSSRSSSQPASQPNSRPSARPTPPGGD